MMLVYIFFRLLLLALHLTTLLLGNSSLNSLLLNWTHLVGDLGRDCPISNKCTSDLVDCFLLLSGVFNFNETESFRSFGDFGFISISGPSGGGDDFGGFDLDGEVGKDLGKGLVIDREGEVTDEYSALFISVINVIGRGDIPCSALR
jgi:hypothetical protein